MLQQWVARMTLEPTPWVNSTMSALQLADLAALHLANHDGKHFFAESRTFHQDFRCAQHSASFAEQCGSGPR